MAQRARRLIAAAALGALAAACAMTNASEIAVTSAEGGPPPARELDWRPYFESISDGGILVRLGARRLSYWSPDAAVYREFPIAIAELPEYARLGRTTVVARRKHPDWRPTAAMRARNPALPRHVPPGPDNPMGEHALYLGWPNYAIHGTNDPVSIGRATTSGCIRLFAEHIAWLYDHVAVGAPVRVVRDVPPPIPRIKAASSGAPRGAARDSA